MTNTLPNANMTQTVQPAPHRGDGAAYRQLVDALAKELTHTHLMLLSTVPRGGLQVLQPLRVSDTLVKPYTREWQGSDESTWKAIATGKAVKASPSSRYVEGFLKPLGINHAASVAVRDPLFAGFAGALQVHRTADQGPFTEADLTRLSTLATRLGNDLADVRETRAGADRPSPDRAGGWINTAPTRIFAMTPAGTLVLGKAAFANLDDRLADQVLTEAQHRVDRLADAEDAEAFVSTRLQLPDSAGDQWTLNCVVHRAYPALAADGPVVFVCLQPTCPEWSTLRAGDFQADPEMSRLIPALRFMAAEFNRGPTLNEIAKTVHLSPFHFHRRFTELMGLTPKHFMLECQIYDAKGELVAGEKELAKIAADCGFAHQSHFTSRFKQATGLTPTRWRRMAHDRINGVE